MNDIYNHLNLNIMPEEQKQTITTETSKKWSIKLPEFLRSLATAAYVSGGTILLQFIDAAITAFTTTGSLHFDWTNLLLTLKVAGFTLFGDTIRRILKDSATVIRVKPGLSDKVVKTMDDGPGSDVPPVPPGKP